MVGRPPSSGDNTFDYKNEYEEKRRQKLASGKAPKEGKTMC